MSSGFDEIELLVASQSLQDTCKMDYGTPPCLQNFWVSCGDSLRKHSHLLEDSCGITLQGTQLSFSLFKEKTERM